MNQPAESGSRFRIVAYNVEYGHRATAEQIAAAMQAYRPDVIAFNEVPGDGWVQRVGVVLEMPYHYIGEVSSGNHKDKYKAILSRTPLSDPQELVLQGAGWNPAGAVRATTTIAGRAVVIYSLHVSGAAHSTRTPTGPHQAGNLAHRAASADPGAIVVLAGDFNDRMGEPQMNDCLEAGFRATWQDLDIDVTAASGLYTWEVTGQRRAGVIDHVLYRVPSAMRAVDGGIIELDPPLSDHHPVWADLQIDAPAK